MKQESQLTRAAAKSTIRRKISCRGLSAATWLSTSCNQSIAAFSVPSETRPFAALSLTMAVVLDPRMGWLSVECDFYGQLNWRGFAIQNRRFVSPLRNSLERRGNKQGLPTNRPSLGDVTAFIDDRLDDHDSGDVRLLGEEGILRRRREDKSRRLHSACQPHRLFRFGHRLGRNWRATDRDVQQAIKLAAPSP